MDKEIRTIILDMDGTLLNEVNHVTEEIKSHLILLRHKGLHVFIATGRTIKEVQDVLPPDLKVDGIVTANGMAVFAREQKLDKLIEHSLPPQLVQQLVSKARLRNIYYEIHPNRGRRYALKQDKSYIEQLIDRSMPRTVDENEWYARKRAIRQEISWQEELVAQGVAKLYFFSTELNAIQAWQSELNQIKDSIPFSTFSSSEHNVEIMVTGVSKATGIQYLLDHFQLSAAHTLVIGDGENDLPMFRLGAYAVAMQNAPGQVKAHADEVTEFSHKENGLYHFLKKFFG